MRHDWIIAEDGKYIDTPPHRVTIRLYGINREIEQSIYWACYDWAVKPCWRHFWALYFVTFESNNPFRILPMMISNIYHRKYLAVAQGYEEYKRWEADQELRRAQANNPNSNIPFF